MDFSQFDDAEDVPHTFTAAFNSSCPGCGRFISEGDAIAMQDGMAHCEACVHGITPIGKFDGTTSEEMGF